MKERLNKKNISKPIVIFIIVMWALAAFMVGTLVEIKLQTKFGYLYGTGVGYSMENTLTDGSNTLEKIVTEDTALKRGDIISFSTSVMDGKKESWLKRIIALPYETIHIKDNEVYINDKLLDEPYAYYSGTSEGTLTRTLGENEYFVMGDNRLDSSDSRLIGPIKREKIASVVVKFKK